MSALGANLDTRKTVRVLALQLAIASVEPAAYEVGMGHPSVSFKDRAKAFESYILDGEF